jgi:hypothetical protein
MQLYNIPLTKNFPKKENKTVGEVHKEHFVDYPWTLFSFGQTRVDTSRGSYNIVKGCGIKTL